MHLGKKEALIMKIDLLKAYDSVDWYFIRLVLMKVGLPIASIKWIMACITSIRYTVIIDGMPNTFFDARCGLR